MATNNTSKTRVASETNLKQTDSKQKFSAKDIDMTQYVTVKNGFQGKLFYRSKHTGETFVWSNFGDEQEMELRELKNARNSSKKFFINNWFMFDEDWIIDFLGVRNYYKHAVKIEDFDVIFEQPVEKIKEIISEMSAGQKKSVAYRARQLIKEQKIDSNKSINALEESLGVELIER